MKLNQAVCMLIAAVWPAAADANCDSWALNGTYAIQQGDGTVVTADLTQDGNRISGSAWFYARTVKGRVNGPVQGFVNGNSLRLRINWNYLRTECGVLTCDDFEFNHVGVYEGSINQNGEVEGVAVLFDKPDSRTNWIARQLAQCIPASSRPAPPPPAPPPRAPDPLRSPDAGYSDVRVFSPSNSRVTGKAGSGAIAASGYGSGSPCKDGLVPRGANAQDIVCVSLAEHDLVLRENAEAPRHWVNGAYGPQTCVSGLVWREAFSGDTVCVTPQRRQQVKSDNAN